MHKRIFSLVIRWLITALGVVIAAKLVPGIRYDDAITLFVVVILLSFLNAALRPFLLLFTLPFIILTAGIGIVVINALLFLFVGHVVSGFHVDGFWPALWGSLIVSITSLFLSVFFRPQRQRGVPPAGQTPRAERPPRDKGGDVIDI